MACVLEECNGTDVRVRVGRRTIEFCEDDLFKCPETQGRVTICGRYSFGRYKTKFGV